MANFLEAIAQLLQGNSPPTNRLADPYLGWQRGLGSDSGHMAPMGASAAVAAPAQPAQQSFGYPSASEPVAAPAPVQQPARQEGGGGFLSGLFGQSPRAKERLAAQYLQRQGLDEGTAMLVAGNPNLLARVVGQQISQGPTDPLDIEYKRAQIDNIRSQIDERRGTKEGYRQLTDDEIAQRGLPPGDYQMSGDGKVELISTMREQDPTFGRYQDVRKEIQQLPSYKNFAQAAPIYDTMVDASGRDTKAADLNLVYGLGKIFDPGSVVREGEMVMVKDTASLPDWLTGAINSLNGGARLSAGTRNMILKEARSRIESYKSMVDTDMQQYRALAQEFGLKEEFLIPPIPGLRDLPPMRDEAEALPLPPATPSAPAPAAPPAAPQQGGNVIEWQDWLAPGRRR